MRFFSHIWYRTRLKCSELVHKSTLFGDILYNVRNSSVGKMCILLTWIVSDGIRLVRMDLKCNYI